MAACLTMGMQGEQKVKGGCKCKLEAEASPNRRGAYHQVEARGQSQSFFARPP
jgi:hypothetical protein